MAETDINRLSNIIIGKAIKIHRFLGPGLLESAYQHCLKYELEKEDLYVEIEKAVPVVYETVHLQYGYRINLLVENLIVVELKCVEAFTEVHMAQILTYLKGYSLILRC